MKRTRRTALAVLVVSLILAIGLATSAYAVTTWVAYMHQEGGATSYSYQGWYVLDAPAVDVRNLGQDIGVFDLHDSQVAVWADTVDMGDVGSQSQPVAVGTIQASAKSQLKIANTGIYSFGTSQFQGPQVVFSTESGTLIKLVGCFVYADANAARGLYTQQAAEIEAEKCNIVTYAAGDGIAVATGYDGGGYIRLHDSEVHSWGSGNAAALYSSAAMFVNESKVYAHESEAVWLDGGGDLVLDWRPPDESYALAVYDSSLYSYKSYGVSFAKSPFTVVADDGPCRFAMLNGYLESAKDLFYAPNSKAHIVLYHADTKAGNGVVLTTKWSGEGPGGGKPTEEFGPGSRESDVVLESIGSRLRGDIITDVDEFSRKDSVVTFLMSDWAWFDGAINKTDKGTVNLGMAKEAVWKVTATSHVGTLNVPTINTVRKGYDGRNYFTFSPDLSNIQSNGYNVYYNAFSNPSIQAIKYALPGGGWLLPAVPVGIAGLWRYGD